MKNILLAMTLAVAAVPFTFAAQTQSKPAANPPASATAPASSSSSTSGTSTTPATKTKKHSKTHAKKPAKGSTTTPAPSGGSSK